MFFVEGTQIFPASAAVKHKGAAAEQNTSAYEQNPRDEDKATPRFLPVKVEFSISEPKLNIAGQVEYPAKSTALDILDCYIAMKLAP